MIAKSAIIEEGFYRKFRRYKVEQPLVCIVTPVYNGEKFIREAIESVLAQTYKNWTYVIFNNCSTDRSLEIAMEYAAGDARIRVCSSERFLDIYDSLNASMREISLDCKYCKPLHADDALFPDCILEMVRLAELHPSAGIVGAYAIADLNVVWDGYMHYSDSLVTGPSISRSMLMGEPYTFGSPTSTMLRADLVRKRPVLYNTLNPNPDVEVCLDLLQESDFAFVHKILTMTRLHPESQTSRARQTGSGVFGKLVALKAYGPVYLTPEEYKQCMEDWLLLYLQTHFRYSIGGRGKAFKTYYKEHLRILDARIKWLDVIRVLFKGLTHLRVKFSGRGILISSKI
jgi:glycosyltransferase involved in cell wall biosynthesis